MQTEIPHFLFVDLPDGREDMKAVLEFRRGEGPQQQERPAIPGLLLWASTLQGNQEPLDLAEERELYEQNAMQVQEVSYVREVSELLDRFTPELLILSCHNGTDRLLLQVDSLPHEALYQLLLNRVARGVPCPCCIFLAVCGGEGLAGKLHHIQGIDLTLYWARHGDGVPTRVASVFTQIFANKLLAPDISQLPGWLRYFTAFNAAKGVFYERYGGGRFLELGYDDTPKNRDLVEPWVDPDRPLLKYLPNERLKATIEGLSPLDPTQSAPMVRSNEQEPPTTDISSGGATSPVQSTSQTELVAVEGEHVRPVHNDSA